MGVPGTIPTQCFGVKKAKVVVIAILIGTGI